MAERNGAEPNNESAIDKFIARVKERATELDAYKVAYTFRDPAAIVILQIWPGGDLLTIAICATSLELEQNSTNVTYLADSRFDNAKQLLVSLGEARA